MTDEKKKRLFVALPLSMATRQALLAVRAEQENFLRQAMWVPLENLHVTVFFIGYVSEGDVTMIEQELAQIAAAAVPFTLTLREVLWAPPGRPPRMIWADFTSSSGYKNLCERVRDRLSQKLGIEPEERESLAHVTLVRFHDRVDRERKLSQPTVVGQEVPITGYELMESKLSSTGARYQVLREFNFTAGKL